MSHSLGTAARDGAAGPAPDENRDGTNVNATLRAWLHNRAHVHEKILARTLAKLEELEVFEVDDLLHLRSCGALAEHFSGVT